MARIGHRCSCGCSDLEHTGNGGAATLGACKGRRGYSCGRGCGPTPEPALYPTFDEKGRPIERIIPPGEPIRSVSGATVVTTCPCDACGALYEQLVTATPA